MDINIGNITKALENPRLQNLLGFLYFQQNLHGTGKMIDGTMTEIQYLMSDFHFPDLSHMAEDMTKGASKPVFKNLLMLLVGGWLLEEIDIVPQLSDIGRLAKGFGMNGIWGALAGSVLLHSGIAHSAQSSGSSGASGGNPFEGVYGK